MLERSELERVSRRKGLSIKNTEKDYLLELLLSLLYRELGRKLVFKGGTALYKLYSLNRFSEDLDFTLASSKIKIAPLLPKILRRLQEISLHAKIKEIDDYQNQKNIKLELRGPLFDGNVKNLSLLSLNISLREKPVLEPEQQTLFSSYPDIVSFDVFAMPLPELLAEKIRTILVRNKARDVYDCWFLLRKGAAVDLALINRKLRLYKIMFDRQTFLEKMEEKKGSWQLDLAGLIIGRLPDFDLIKREIDELTTPFS